MSELARSVGLLSFRQAVLVVLGAARAKVAASLLGPAGTGLLAQAASLLDLLRQVSMLGSANGFLKIVAERYGRDDRTGLERLLVTALALFGSLALVLAAASVALAPRLARWVFDDPGYAPLVVLVAVTLLFVVPKTLSARVLSGSLHFRSYVQLAVVESLVALVAMAALAWRLGLTGAVAALVVAEAAALLLGVMLVRRHVVVPQRLRLRPAAADADTVRKLVRYAGALALTSVAAAGSTLLVRGEIIRAYGSEANGFYQVAWQVGQNYLGILATSLWTYGMPKVATKLDDPAAVLALQNDFLRIALVVLAPGIVALLATRELWVPVLYTEVFLAAGTMLCWQLAGELVAMMRQSMNISLLPRERLGFLVFQAVLYWGGWALSSWLLLPRLGAVAVAFSYWAANLIALLATYAYHRSALGYRVRRENVALLAVVAPGFALSVVLASRDDAVVGRAVPLALAAAWVLWNLRLYGELLGVGRLARRGRER
ncbi:MAG: oligosaccharide flippase family protein [Thermodesulfobacteriota bacterium]